MFQPQDWAVMLLWWLGLGSKIKKHSFYKVGTPGIFSPMGAVVLLTRPPKIVNACPFYTEQLE